MRKKLYMSSSSKFRKDNYFLISTLNLHAYLFINICSTGSQFFEAPKID